MEFGNWQGGEWRQDVDGVRAKFDLPEVKNRPGKQPFGRRDLPSISEDSWQIADLSQVASEPMQPVRMPHLNRQSRSTRSPCPFSAAHFAAPLLSERPLPTRCVCSDGAG